MVAKNRQEQPAQQPETILSFSEHLAQVNSEKETAFKVGQCVTLNGLDKGMTIIAIKDNTTVKTVYFNGNDELMGAEVPISCIRLFDNPEAI